MTIIDKDLMAAIEAEFMALKHGPLVSADVPVTITPPEPVPEVPVVVEAPAYWPGHKMFSKVFGRVPKGKRDIPVPLFKAEDWPEQARPMIPTKPEYWVHNVDTMYGIALAVLANDTTLLTGPTGTGKTASIYAFAAECGIPVWLTSCYSRMEPTEFLGSSSLKADAESGANITEYNWTQLTSSLRYGGFCTIDEAFRSPVLMSIQRLLEDSHTLVLAEADGLAEHERMLVGQPGRWWCFLTDNTCGTGDHTGSYNAEVQDLSTLDRITSTLYVDYNSPGVEVRIVSRAVPTLQAEDIKNMVSVAGLVREAFKKGQVMQTMSMRALLSWARKYSITGSLDYSFTRSYFSKLDPDSAGVVNEVWHQVFGKSLASS